LDEAQQHLETSASLYHTMHYRANESLALSRLAAIEDARREFAQAAGHASHALELARQVSDPEALWNAAEAAAHENLRLGKRAEARAEFLEAIDTIESLRGQVAGGEQDRERFFEDKVAPYNELVKLSLDDGHPNDELAYAERAKARVLLEALRDKRVVISKNMTAEERSRERALLDRIAALNGRLKEEDSPRESNRDRAAQLHTRLDALRREYEAFQSRLYASHPELAVNRIETPRPSLREIAARLPDEKAVALEYVVTEEGTFLFVVSKRTPYLRHFAIHISSAELNAKVRRFSENLGRRGLDFGADAEELYRLLVSPAEEALREKTTLVIVPDSVLWQLPFQALATAADRYLIERASIFYAPSLTVLAEMLRRHPPGRQPRSLTLLAMGNPAGPAASLPDAESEVNALREIYGAANSRILTGEEATEAAFKQQAGKFAILHVAAHAVLDDRSPLYSHLVLSPGRGSSEDGMLEAREMMDLDLKAEVVVLSACETARGRLGGGEGLIGMTWALFIAGSPATVATSWKIDSASAALFTVEFHRRLKEGLSKASAMRQAALAVMGLPGYQHPYYWSGFSLVGQGF
jgi:CHAT domain-containing protein